ncbi:hypothetical protein FDP41_012842 [Naegleria fowleri]|uniref:Ribosomal protein/NADH dehydrogenase domain-containing protein n=1 Tax=Naegleria fowleri TaxID=5763 RepID=A0A6A5C3G7_NAEFO|nr:uncharacterized protein FDP41_012842 [Naegleria fowleri]KAF0981054.1 hypothetical protein FDP41_012842 [Naegleria fowleri]CAG4712685.1 unnamed protein product [Naegleria fowleri]
MSWRGKLSKNVHQLIFYFCPKNAQSKGVRDFLQNNYADIKTLNPYTGLLVRETPDIDEPFMMVERHYGVREKQDLKNLTASDIENIIKQVTLERERPRDTRPLHERVNDIVSEEYLRLNPEMPYRF